MYNATLTATCSEDKGCLKHLWDAGFMLVGELLSPTRCILCEEPGLDLCPKCYQKLPYIDRWQACPHCGQEFGAQICCDCLSEKIASMGFNPAVLSRTYAALELNELSRRIILGFKEQGQQSLARVMAAIMAQCLSQEDVRSIDLVTYIPDSKKALRKRGFDHGRLLGEAVARELKLPCLSTLERPQSADQRKLDLSMRAQNMKTAIKVRKGLNLSGLSILLVDDVCTTQATLYAAGTALQDLEAHEIQGLCFARTS